jgi:hypothetical protein
LIFERSVLTLSVLGEMWSFHRSMTRPFFSRDRVQHFDIFDRHTERVIALIKGRMAEGYAVDFQVRPHTARRAI